MRALVTRDIAHTLCRCCFLASGLCVPRPLCAQGMLMPASRGAWGQAGQHAPGPWHVRGGQQGGPGLSCSCLGQGGGGQAPLSRPGQPSA